MIDAVRRWLLRVTAFVRPRSLDDDLREQIDSHLALSIDDHMRRGLTRKEATRRARIDLGGVLASTERHRDARGLPLLEHLLQDVSYASRSIRRWWTSASLPSTDRKSLIATTRPSSGSSAAKTTPMPPSPMRPRMR